MTEIQKEKDAAKSTESLCSMYKITIISGLSKAGYPKEGFIVIKKGSEGEAHLIYDTLEQSVIAAAGMGLDAACTVWRVQE